MVGYGTMMVVTAAGGGHSTLMGTAQWSGYATVVWAGHSHLGHMHDPFSAGHLRTAPASQDLSCAGMGEGHRQWERGTGNQKEGTDMGERHQPRGCDADDACKSPWAGMGWEGTLAHDEIWRHAGLACQTGHVQLLHLPENAIYGCPTHLCKRMQSGMAGWQPPCKLHVHGVSGDCLGTMPSSAKGACRDTEIEKRLLSRHSQST